MGGEGVGRWGGGGGGVGGGGRGGVILPGHLKVESVIVEIGILENEILEIGILENEIVGILCPTEFRLSYFLSPRFSKLQPFHWT